jgi:hypothetical protein
LSIRTLTLSPAEAAATAAAAEVGVVKKLRPLRFRSKAGLAAATWKTGVGAAELHADGSTDGTQLPATERLSIEHRDGA